MSRFLVDTLTHPLHGDGYQFWSGIGANVFLLAPITIFWRRHNCHVSGCPRLIWHHHPDHGHPVCRKHHPAGPLGQS